MQWSLFFVSTMPTAMDAPTGLGLPSPPRQIRRRPSHLRSSSLLSSPGPAATCRQRRLGRARRDEIRIVFGCAARRRDAGFLRTTRGEFLGRAARRGAVGPARLSRVPPLARGVASPTSNLIRATTKMTGEDSHMATTSTIARAGGATVGKGDGRRRARGGQAPTVPRARELGSPTTARRGMAVGALAGGGAVGRVRAGAG